MAEARPILYSFRRCPYAIRARLALAAAGLAPGADLELREVSLKAKPAELLAASAKGTVPVLVEGEQVLDESLAIMHRALERWDPHRWWSGWSPADQAVMTELITENDGPFKRHLDRFKYAGRFGPEGLAEQNTHRQAALAILRGWCQRLERGDWLLGERPSLADWALLPFVRQLRLAGAAGFDAEPGLEPLQAWLGRFLAGAELAAVLEPPWAPRSIWRSPGWLYHLALRDEWRAACATGVYSRSTRGRSLQEEGFIHLSTAVQVAATAERFFSDLPAADLMVLILDPSRLNAELRFETAAAQGESFPHLYGPLPLDAVVLATPWHR